jgi:hypothetical protein
VTQNSDIKVKQKDFKKGGAGMVFPEKGRAGRNYELKIKN